MNETRKNTNRDTLKNARSILNVLPNNPFQKVLLVFINIATKNRE